MKRIFILSLMVIFFASLSVAQELRQFKVKEEPRPSSIPVFTQFPKDAAVIIYSSNSGLSFESNTDGIIANKSVEGENKYVLILRTETQTLTVKSPGFMETKLKIQRMQAKDVKYYSIESTARSFDPEKGDLVLRTVPAGAKILIDSLPDFDHYTPFSLNNFEAKSYNIKLIKDDYDTVLVKIDIKKGEKISKIVELTPRFGLLLVETERDNELRVDDRLIPFEPGVPVRIPVGKRKITLSKPKYIPDSRIFEIGPNDNPANAIPLKTSLIPDFGTWEFKISPSFAKVYLDDSYFFTDSASVEIPAGKRKFRIQAVGYEDTIFTETVRRLESRVVGISLRRQTGRLQVSSEPDEAEIYLGDSLLGYTPFFAENIPTGSYVLSIRKERYRTVDFPMNLRKGELVSRSVTLETQGRLTVTGTPGATFRVFSRDSNPFDLESTIPVYKMNLNPGKYTIYFNFPGYEKESRDFTIEDQDEVLDFDLTQTDGKFFRFTAFGNQRIYNLYDDRAGISFVWARQEFKSELMSELTRKKVGKFSVDSYNIEIPMEAPPFRFIIGYGINEKKTYYSSYNPVTEAGEKLSGGFRFENYFLSFTYTPFVLAERFSPSVGFRMEKLDLFFKDNTSGETKRKSIVNGSPSLDFNFYLSNKGSTPFFKVSWLPYDGNKWAESRTSIHFGLLF
ncbi:MAG: PEGA domain-containing protein [Bacteroidetes bacterium]|nr:PEGA domain-containing protein [Bacteroidota bacterium]